MPAHRADQVLDAVLTSIGVATTAGVNVYRNAARALPANTDYMIEVNQGPDSDPERIGNFIDSWLTVYVDLFARSIQPNTRTSASKPAYETSLATLRKEVHINLMADITQGLGFVIDTEPQGAQEPIPNGDGEQVIAEMRTIWRIKYRTSYTDPSA